MSCPKHLDSDFLLHTSSWRADTMVFPLHPRPRSPSPVCPPTTSLWTRSANQSRCVQLWYVSAALSGSAASRSLMPHWPDHRGAPCSTPELPPKSCSHLTLPHLPPLQKKVEMGVLLMSCHFSLWVQLFSFVLFSGWSNAQKNLDTSPPPDQNHLSVELLSSPIQILTLTLLSSQSLLMSCSCLAGPRSSSSDSNSELQAKASSHQCEHTCKKF